MASTTALTMVNRLLRRHGFEDYSALTLPETLLALDLVNQAIRDLTAVHDYPWNIRSDGAAYIFAPITGSGASVTAAGSVVTINPMIGSATSYTGGAAEGSMVAKLLLTSATSHSTTAMTALNVSSVGTTLTVNLTNFWPGETITGGDYKFFFNEYLTGDEVAKVLSVRHQDQPLRLVEVNPHTGFDEMFPRPHDSFGPPSVVLVGGSLQATYVEGSVPTQGLRFAIWPIPEEDLALDFTYKVRISELTTATSTLNAPSEFVDDVIDRAEALSNMTQRFNAPELAQLQLRSSTASAERKWTNSTLDPSRRHPLRAHDRGWRRTEW